MKRLMILLACLLFPVAPTAAQDKVVKIVTTEIPGFVEKDGGGQFMDFFRKAADKTGFSIELQLMPWQRAVRRVERSRDSMIIPFSRTPEREDRFTWGAIFNEVHNGFVSVEKIVNTLDEGRKLETVIVWKGSSQEAFLQENGFDNLYPVSSADTIFSLLKTGRATAWYGVLEEARSTIADDETSQTLLLGTPVNSEGVWIAGGKGLDPAPYKAFFEEVERMRRSAAQ